MLHNLAKLIPVEGEAMLLDLVGRIERHRALTDDESRLVEALIRKEKRRREIRVIHIWTHAEKTSLLRAAKLRGGVKKFAAEHGMADRIAWHMLRNLRNSANRCEKVKG